MEIVDFAQVYELQSLFLAKMPKISKKIHTAIYVMKHGHEHTEYAGFANLPEKEIYTKLRKLNKSRNKTYWLEGEVPAFVLLTREMIVPIRKKYRIKDGADIERYVGNYCGIYPDDEIVDRLKKLTAMSLVKAYLHVKSNGYLSNYYINLKYHLSMILEKNYINLDGLSLYDFEDDSHLELAPDYANQ